MTRHGQHLTSDELARALGVSRSMVHKYVGRGMPVAPRDGRSLRFDLPACLAWRNARVAGVAEATGKGGKRGGGRKKRRATEGGQKKRDGERGEGDSRAGGPTGSSVGSSGGSGGAGGRSAGAVDVDGFVPAEVEREVLELLRRKEASGEQLTFADLAKLPSGTIAALERVENVLKKQSERMKDEGRLVDAREVEAAFGERLRDASRMLSRLPRRLSRLVAEEVDLESSLHGGVEAVIRGEVERVIASLGGEGRA